jgi:hypothetical protein
MNVVLNGSNEGWTEEATSLMGDEKTFTVMEIDGEDFLGICQKMRKDLRYRCSYYKEEGKAVFTPEEM